MRREPTPDIELHIERLVLHGVAHSEREPFVEQLTRALGTALRARGLGSFAVHGAAIEALRVQMQPPAQRPPHASAAGTADGPGGMAGDALASALTRPL